MCPGVCHVTRSPGWESLLCFIQVPSSSPQLLALLHSLSCQQYEESERIPEKPSDQPAPAGANFSTLF